jgi:triosephosphate isomerase
MKNKKSFCIANWKMNKNLIESNNFLDKLYLKDLSVSKSNIVICPSFLSLSDLLDHSKSDVAFGAQNICYEEKGSYTGEVSISMLESIKCEWVIVGHSERRQLFSESNTEIAKKMLLVMNSKLNPILCVGESLEERNADSTKSVLEHQIDSAFSKIKDGKFNHKNILIAYEPVWAIGTGISADIDIIDKNISIIKKIINKYDINNCNIYLLYGGSVNEVNAAEIFKINDMNGFLIGTSSLEVDTFYKIFKQI